MTHTEEIQLSLRAPKAELNSGGTTILLVEDEKFVCEVANEILWSAGYRPQPFPKRRFVTPKLHCWGAMRRL